MQWKKNCKKTSVNQMSFKIYHIWMWKHGRYTVYLSILMNYDTYIFSMYIKQMYVCLSVSLSFMHLKTTGPILTKFWQIISCIESPL